MKTVGTVGLGMLVTNATLQQAYAGDVQRPGIHANAPDLNTQYIDDAIDNAYQTRSGGTGDPLSDLPASSTPIASYAKPGIGNLSGADGSVDSTVWYAIDVNGVVYEMDGTNPVPIQPPIGTGIAATGIAMTPTGLTISDNGGILYHGDINGGTWNQSSTSNLDVSGVLDVDYALGSFWISTSGNGIREVLDLGSGATNQIDPINGQRGLDMITFMNGSYDNPLMNLQQGNNTYVNIDTNGVPTSGSQTLDSNNFFNIEGIAYFQGGWSAAQGLGVDVHAELGVGGIIQQQMLPVETPPPKSADFDLDGDIDLMDWKVFQDCYADISKSVSGMDCIEADLNWSGDMDPGDVEEMVSQTTGP